MDDNIINQRMSSINSTISSAENYLDNGWEDYDVATWFKNRSDIILEALELLRDTYQLQIKEIENREASND